MANSIELDNLSNSWDEHSVSSDHHDLTAPTQVVAQAAPAEQAAAPVQTAPAAAEPVPVDVGGGAPAAAPPAANAPHEYVADASNVVKLPANVSIDNIKVDGHNLVLEQADGSVIVIKDGALHVPTFIIGDVEVPRVALIAALEASHVDVAFGADGSISAGGSTTSSAGGNFEQPAGGIGDGFGLSALLPPTALQFGQLERHELFPSLVDRGVSVVAMSLTNPDQAASETGLDGGAQQSPGSEAPTNSETSGVGTISIDAPDGIGSIVINGTTVTGVGQQISGQFGYITILSYDPGTGAIQYDYTVTQSVTHPVSTTGYDANDTVPDNFSITVTDVDGDTASTTFTVAIIDDVPTAVVDTDSIAAGQFGPATGNVLVGGTDAGDANTTDGVADIQGADGATVVGVAKGTTNVALDNTTTLNSPIQGEYGKLTLHGDGSYTYVRDAGTPGGVNDVFTYTIKDGDGDTSHTTLTISIGNSTPVVANLTPEANGGDVIVNEAALNVGTPGGPGSDPASTAETGPGTFTISSPDGIHDLSIDGHAFITDGVFTASSFTTTLGNTLTVTAYNAGTGEVSYTYTLNDNETHTSVQGTNSLFENFTVTLTDQDLQSTNGTLTVNIVDDVPTAHDEASQAVVEGAPVVTGTLDFVAGADGATVTHVNGTLLTFDPGTGYSQSIDIGAGTIQVKADGAYSFTADASVDNSGGAVAVNATYTVTDGDHDTSTANIAFTITDGAGPTAGAPITLALDDQNLSDGSTPLGPDSASNSITFTPGSDAITSVVFGTDLGGLNTANLTWTRVSDTQVVGKDGAVTVVTLDLSVANNVATVTATLNDNYDAHPGINLDDLVDLGHVGVVATDTDGTQATGTVNLTVSDDVPTAHDEASQAVVEGAPAVTGTLDFVAGADGATVTHVNGTLLTFDPGTGYSQSIDIGAGTIQVKADGAYSFTADASVDNSGGAVAVNATYTVTDGDHDTSTANIAFTITDGAGPTAGAPITLALDDQNLSDGSTPLGPDSASNSITFTPGSDAITSVVFGTDLGGLNTANLTWTRVSDTQVVGKDGAVTVVTLDLSVANNVATVTATLNDNYDAHPGINLDDLVDLGHVGVVATDTDGTQATGTVNVTVSDDVPTAHDEASQNVAEGATITGTLDFVAGADGATVTHIGSTVLVFGNDGYSQAIDIGDGSIKVMADGHYSFTADSSVLGTGAASATYTVTDGDGDTATAGITFAVTDANTPTSGTATAAVDDDGLAGGNPASTLGDIDANLGEVPFSASEKTYNGALGGSVGGDGAGANGFSFATLDGTNGTVGQENVTYSWDAGSDTLTATGPRGVLFTVHVTDPATGAYTVTLVDNVLQAQGPNDENNATVDLDYVITDADGSTAPGTLTITFNDDGPSVTVGTVADSALTLVTQDADTIGNNTDTASASFAAAFLGAVTPSYGADGAGSTVISGYTLSVTAPGENSGLTSQGEAITLSKVGNDIVGTTATHGDVFMISVNAAGTVTLTQYQQIDHLPESLDTTNNNAHIDLANGLVTLSATATVTDGDNDQATSTVSADLGGNLGFDDALPTLSVAAIGDAIKVVTQDA
ncbi:beta strand repeat-containing protein, partial [Mesorhizobium sp. BR-1-1-10]|uniref:beta strand repeat-containing protein n=1 Tax=Mesorhizobium sp. BR-1-1-10 TaxID=2876660 RepID=UPI001CD128D7